MLYIKHQAGQSTSTRDPRAQAYSGVQAAGGQPSGLLSVVGFVFHPPGPIHGTLLCLQKHFPYACAMSEQKQFLPVDQCEEPHAFGSPLLALVTSAAGGCMENGQNIHFWDPGEFLLLSFHLLPARSRHSSLSLLRFSFLGEVRLRWRPRPLLPVVKLAGQGCSGGLARSGGRARDGGRTAPTGRVCGHLGCPEKVSSLGLFSWGRGSCVRSHKYYFFQRQITFKGMRC